MRTIRAVSWSQVAAYTVAGLMLAFVAAAVSGQDSLKVDGNTKTIKVKKVITVEEDALIVMLPTKIVAPSGGFQYRFTYPAGVVAVRKSNVLHVTAAPKGPVTFSVEYVSIDFDKKIAVEKFVETTFNIGDVGSDPPPVDPPPPQDDQLTKDLKAAAVKDGPTHLAMLPELIAACNSTATASASPIQKTTKDMRDYWIDAVKLGVSPNLPYVRGVIVKHLDANLPTTDVTLTPAIRAKYKEVYERLAKSLKAVQP